MIKQETYDKIKAELPVIIVAGIVTLFSSWLFNAGKTTWQNAIGAFIGCVIVVVVTAGIIDLLLSRLVEREPIREITEEDMKRMDEDFNKMIDYIRKNPPMR